MHRKYNTDNNKHVSAHLSKLVKIREKIRRKRFISETLKQIESLETPKTKPKKYIYYTDVLHPKSLRRTNRTFLSIRYVYNANVH